jgi:hypothetical protein
MRKAIIIFFIFICFLDFCFAENEWSKEDDSDIQRKMIIKVSDGFVPDPETAIKIAEAVLSAIYGEKVLEKEPFIASLVQNGTVWLVQGTLPQKGIYGGGVPYIKISKETGEILGVVHTK